MRLICFKLAIKTKMKKLTLPSTMLQNFTITTANKSDKKAILRFYRQQHYSARFIGLDTCYLIYQEDQPECIIASVIISQIDLANNQPLLHALVINKAWQQQGLASLLMKHVTAQHENLICFADGKLSSLYTGAGFDIVEPQELTRYLNEQLMPRYLSYQSKQPNLKVLLTNCK